MERKQLTSAVGNPVGLGRYPANLDKDVAYVRLMLYLIPPDEGGPFGDTELMVCNPRNTTVDTNALARAILKFQNVQKQKKISSSLLHEDWQGEEAAGGRVMNGSQTLRLLQLKADAAEDANRNSAALSQALMADSFRRGVSEADRTRKPDDYPTTTVCIRDTRLKGCSPKAKYLLEVGKDTAIALPIKWVCDQYDALGGAPLTVEIFAHGYVTPMMSGTPPGFNKEITVGCAT
jgi:hypothetical protein